jgi:transposase-like protein
MNSNQSSSAVQEYVQNLSAQLQHDQFLNTLLRPEELKGFLQDAFSKLLEAALLKERQFHLQNHPEDRANGYAPERTFHIGTTPLELHRPRTRQGFYPALLPKHQRYLPDSYQDLFYSILLQAKSFKAALRTMQNLGLPYAPEQVQELLAELDQEAREFFNRPLSPDWLFLYIDAKVVELKDEHDKIKRAIHFLVIGLCPSGQKQILTAQIFWGNEELEAWRKVLINLKNRGLTRVLGIITDDFSGLAPLLKSLFPNSDHQLCCVHLFRNAHRHLSDQEFATFKQTWAEIYAASSLQTAQEKFQALLELLRPTNSAYVEHLQQRKNHYLHFMKYPQIIRSLIRTTNLPEGINNLIENLRRNAGGHFHSEREARIKLKLLSDQLLAGSWKNTNPKIGSQIPALTSLFKQRFESELSENFLTQKF